MKATIAISLALCAGLVPTGCRTIEKHSEPISLEQARPIAEKYAESQNRDLRGYRLASARHSSLWFFDYSPVAASEGKRYSVIVNEHSGKVGTLSRKREAVVFTASPRILTRPEAEQVAASYASQDIDIAQHRIVIADHDTEWSFFFDGLKGVVGDHFSIVVNDQTGKCVLIPGE